MKTFEHPEMGKIDMYEVPASQLNNLTMKILVIPDGPIETICGVDVDSGLIYVLAERFVGRGMDEGRPRRGRPPKE